MLPKLDTDTILRSSLAYTLTISIISITPLNIDVLPALKARLLPTIKAISHLARMKVDVQLKPHSSPSFQPLPNPDNPEEFLLSKEQQAIFVNGEWNIHNTISRHPQIQFLLWIVPKQFVPLTVATENPAQDDPHSFWYPQHGGVYVLNDASPSTLDRAFVVFERHLCTLMGLERNVLGIDSSEEFALDRLTMQHMQLEYKEALKTLEQFKGLVDSNPSMPVPAQLALKFDTIMTDLKSQSNTSLDSKEMSLNERFGIVKEARHAAEALFFSPEMFPRSYYPKEHKLGVYGPLFFPVLLPIIAAIIRYIKWGRNQCNCGDTMRSTRSRTIKSLMQ